MLLGKKKTYRKTLEKSFKMSVNGSVCHWSSLSRSFLMSSKTLIAKWWSIFLYPLLSSFLRLLFYYFLLLFSNSFFIFVYFYWHLTISFKKQKQTREHLTSHFYLVIALSNILFSWIVSPQSCPYALTLLASLSMYAILASTMNVIHAMINSLKQFIIIAQVLSPTTQSKIFSVNLTSWRLPIVPAMCPSRRSSHMRA